MGEDNGEAWARGEATTVRREARGVRREERGKRKEGRGKNVEAEAKTAAHRAAFCYLVTPSRSSRRSFAGVKDARK
jgi:hypothetical protein